jgi:hypothetical protein
LKTKLRTLARGGWAMLTAIPGWPDAPKTVRLRRALPIALPCVIILALLGWKLAVRDPQRRAERAAYQPLMSLEKENDRLRLACSQREAAELAVHTAEVAKTLVNGPADLSPTLDALKKAAAVEHWDASFRTTDLYSDISTPGALVQLQGVRGLLTPMADNTQPLPTLLILLDRFSAAKKRTELTRLVIRADEQGRYAVETYLRLACRVTP